MVNDIEATVGLLCGVIVVVVVLALFGLDSAANIGQPIGNEGSILGELNLYSDLQGNNEVSFISWGELIPGETKTLMFFVESPFDSGLLTVSLESWNPVEAKEYIQVVVEPHRVVTRKVQPANFTLIVSEEIVGIETFTFDIVLQVSKEIT